MVVGDPLTFSSPQALAPIAAQHISASRDPRADTLPAFPRQREDDRCDGARVHGLAAAGHRQRGQQPEQVRRWRAGARATSLGPDQGA